MCPTMLDLLRKLSFLDPWNSILQPFFSFFFFLSFSSSKASGSLWCLRIFMCISLYTEEFLTLTTETYTILTNSTGLSGDASETLQFGLGIFPCLSITSCTFPIVALLHPVIIICLLLYYLHLQIIKQSYL